MLEGVPGEECWGRHVSVQSLCIYSQYVQSKRPGQGVLQGRSVGVFVHALVCVLRAGVECMGVGAAIRS